MRPPLHGPAAVLPDPFADARAVADAVLYEGYLLYPYRRSSGKNMVRWQFGVLAPKLWITANRIPDPGVAGSGESWFQQAEFLAEGAMDAHLRVQVRFLQLVRRQVRDSTRQAVDVINAGGRTELTFDEGHPHEMAAQFAVADLLHGARESAVDVPAERRTELLPEGAGELERVCQPLRGRIIASADRPDAPFPVLRLRLRFENAATGSAASRDDALRESFVATHLLVGLDRGRFLSLLDPPAWASAVAKDCVNRHVFPVLAGRPDQTDVLLCAPIILSDHPGISPESAGDLHDATEIDEILSLRTLTLTEDEKREARATDPRAAAIVDRVDNMSPELLARLHGVIRPAAKVDDDTLVVSGIRIGPGGKVRLRPRERGTDAHDMFLAGRTGTVHAVLHDVDGSSRLAVTVDGDPAADLHEWYGRFLHFRPEEVEPL
ncbi:MAG TPA: hypothetical protein VKB75_05550 [Jatrophihabitans sp.]|nr:hypothetical protein [Jatrophihabitans sp.]